MLEVHAVPGETEDFALPQPGKKRHQKQMLVGVALNGLEKNRNVLLLHGLDLLPARSRKITHIRRVAADHAQLHRLGQSPVQNPVDILDRLGGQSPFQKQAIVHALDLRRSQLSQTNAPQTWDQKAPAYTLIGVSRVGLDRHGNIGFEPDLQPFAYGFLERFKIAAVVDLCRDLCQLFAHFFLRRTVNGALDLLPCPGIEAHGVTAFPPSVRAFADRTAAFCILGRFLVAQ